ncbi:TPA: hypothetical protein LU097_000966 [Enterobacter hormaechei subsp. xiangfangensis]|uniref:hypothetical protein n=1 Tax=Enterobacter hormaechei TaxID=158836 RepID=UPI001FF19C50|nr:hypothetical protein [Enterobacter hormaechei]MCK1032706.1 hypothetical protein [Enterobacter hormaechei subsp. xiangfangensis]HBM2778210.1 hypothetical protein [Enterobacter hormaechei subsp. xiangfangensis]HBM2843587.1 hypothetical protein [Enterobacter hormaechei subsp. xiangfangensis]HCQ7830546.1 hypothetical protein [Enterobacter hormaechei]
MDFEFISLSLLAAVVPIVIALISNKNLKELKQKKLDFENTKNLNKKSFEAKKDKLKFR